MDDAASLQGAVVIHDPTKVHVLYLTDDVLVREAPLR